MRTYHEIQPGYSPAWLNLVLEIKVEGHLLCFRVHRKGTWECITVDDITHIQTVRLRQWSWPVMVKISLDGTRQIYTTTLKGVRLETNKGQRIILGSTDPERLASSIAKARTSGT